MPYKEHHQQLLQQQQHQQHVQQQLAQQQAQENKVDLKTPSFIPVEPQKPEQSEEPKEISDQIDPDSLDPNINSKENGQTSAQGKILCKFIPISFLNFVRYLNGLTAVKLFVNKIGKWWEIQILL